MKSYELYNNYRFRLGSNLANGEVYAVNSGISHSLRFDDYNYADLSYAVGGFSEIFAKYHLYDEYDEQSLDWYWYEENLPYINDTIVDIVIDKWNYTVYDDQVVINFGKASSYKNYVTALGITNIIYNVDGKKVCVEPTYKYTGGSENGYDTIKNWRSTIQEYYLNGNSFVLDDAFDKDIMSVWLRPVEAIGVSSCAIRLKVSDSPYDINVIGELFTPEDAKRSLAGAGGYISLADSGVIKGVEYYLCIEPAETDTSESTTIPTPDPTQSTPEPVVTQAPSEGGYSEGYVPYIPPITDSVTTTPTPEPTVTPEPEPTPEPTSTPASDAETVPEPTSESTPEPTSEPTPTPVIETFENEDGSITTTTTIENEDGTIEHEISTKKADGSRETVKTVTDKNGDGTVSGTKINRIGKTVSTTTGTISHDARGTTIVETKTEFTNNSTVEKTVKTTTAGKIVTKEIKRDAKGNIEKTNSILSKKGLISATYSIESGGTAKLTNYESYKSTVKIPSSVTVDGEKHLVTVLSKGSLTDCKNATKIKIGKKITVIGKGVFDGLNNVNVIVIYPDNLVSVKKGAFNGLPENVTIKVKAERKRFAQVKNMIMESGGANNMRIKRAK